MKGEMDRPAVTNPSRFPFTKTIYPTLTWTSQNQTGLNLHIDLPPAMLLTQTEGFEEMSNGD